MIVRQRMSDAEVSDVLGCSPATVQHYRRHLGVYRMSAADGCRKIDLRPIKKEDIERLYLGDKLSILTTAERLGTSADRVKYWMEKHGIAARKSWETSVGKYTGDKASGWRGGRFKDSSGYITVYVKDYEGGKKISYRGRHALEHRLVMEAHLGRRLEKWEIVHHINGIKDDNRLENLQVLPSGEHNKQCQQLYIENQRLKNACISLFLLGCAGRGAV